MKNPFDELLRPIPWPQLGLREYLVLGLIAIGLMALTELAYAQGLGFSDQECRALGHFARTSAEIRDLEARLDRHVALVRRRVAQGGMSLSKVVEAELRRVYAEGLAPEKAETSAYTRCMTGEILRKEG